MGKKLRKFCCECTGMHTLRCPGLKEEPSLPGPGGMEVRFDYRAVLAEVLSRTTSGAQVSKVFPDFTPEKVGLCK